MPPDIVICEFMDEEAVGRLGERYATLYDPALVDHTQELAAQLGSARALIVRNRTKVGAPLLAAGPRLACIGRLGVGLDNIDLEACRAGGIAVYPATGANAVSVAEYVVTAALVLLRRAWFATKVVADGQWPRESLSGREAHGTILGIVGLGRIGRETASRAAALGMEIVAFDPLLAADDPAWRLARRVDLLEALLGQADVVSLHVPLTPQTRRMIDAAAIARMKPGAILINAARGSVVDEAALVEALAAGRLGGAALDVFETEPLTAEAGARFAGLPNLILTPHIAGLTEEANARVSHMIADAVLRHLDSMSAD